MPTSPRACRARAATAWAAAKVSQTGPQRRNRCSASGEGSSCPSTRSVAEGASSAPAPSARSKAIMFRFGWRSASSASWARSNHIPGRPAQKGNPRWGESTGREQDGHEVSSGPLAPRARCHTRVEVPQRAARARRARRSPRTSASASTSSRARRRTSLATSSITSTRRPSRRPRSWPAGPAPHPRPWSASRRRWASRATRSFSRPRSRSTGAVPPENDGAAGPAVRLRPLRVRGVAGRRPRQRRGHGAQPDPRAGRVLRHGAGRARTG